MAAESDKPRFIVVGGGLAGLMTVIKIAEAGYDVRRLLVRARAGARTRCARRAASTARSTPRARATRPRSTSSTRSSGGDFLANQPPVKAMCYAAPGIIYLLDRMGVPFTRTAEGLHRLPPLRRHAAPPHRLRRRHHRASSCSTRSTSRCAATRSPGKVRRFERYEFVGTVRDDERPLPRHRRDGPAHHEARDLPRRRGGAGHRRPGRHLRQVDQLGGQHRHRRGASSTSRARIYANGEFIQVHPTAIPGADKLRLISESLRGEGARVWVPQEEGRHARPPTQIPEARALVLPRGEVSQVQEPGAARRRLARDLHGGARQGPGRRRQGRGLPRHRQARPRRVAGARPRRDRPPRRGRGRDLREVHRRRSAQGADAGLPGGALLDGRAVGRLRPHDQHPRAVRRR